MILKLPLSIRELPGYPTSRKFTRFEAQLDFMLAGPDGEPIGNIAYWCDRWRWTREELAQLTLTNAVEVFVRNPEWYDKESGKERREIAQKVIDVFNEVFDRNIGLNDHRIRTINARIKEGKKLKPPIGLEQFKAVFEFKKKEWTGTEHEKFLTIETLCRPSHFLNYLEAARLDYRKSLQAKKKEEQGVTLTGTIFKSA